jgi:CO/xanthine dehydrogenase Mo-binding subunit
LAEGVIRVKGAPGAQITIKEAAYKAWDRNKPLRAEGHHVYWDPGDPPEQLNYPVAHTVFVIAVHIAQVLVDIETGQVRVEKIWAGHDVGKAINMLGIEGQIDGGIMQGMGTALMEELQIEGGRLMNASMEGYLVPSIMDAPQVEAAILETPQPTGPLGAVGIGESTLNPTAAAIANAIHDAAGVRVWQMPMTPERVLAALRKEGQSVWF